MTLINESLDTVLGKPERERRERGVNQRKRAIALTAFLACLSFLTFGINMLISFFLDLAKSERLWIYLNNRLNQSHNKGS